ncbi:MAG: hypothetical protein AB1801_11060 [Chloroflexota bacterium]
MEKVINEFKVIETDDGFRIEIKGDKELIRRMLGGVGSHFRPKHHHHDFGFGPHFWAGFGDWCGGWPWAEKEGEEKQESH